MRKRFIASVFTLLAAAQLALALPAGAVATQSQNLNDPFANLKATGVSSQDPRDAAGSLPGLIGNLIRVALGLLGVVFLVLIVYAGFIWMTARGDEKMVTRAKDTLQRAVIGLIIVSLAYAITSFVVRGVLTAATPGAVR